MLASGQEAKNDIWIALLLGLAVTFIIVAMYIRIMKRYPGNNLYDVIITVFGPYVGRVTCLIFIFYAFYLGALVLVNFTMFISIVGLETTPEELVAFSVIVLVIIGVKKGVEVLARWSEFFTRFLYPIILLTIPFMLGMVEVNNLKPVLSEGVMPVLDGALGVVVFPFAEIVIFTMVFGSEKIIRVHNLKKVFFWGLLLGGSLVVITDVTAYVVLGGYVYSSSYFPIYTAVSRIDVRDILERVEIIIAVSFLLGGFVKICACIFACGNGIAKVCGLDDYKFLITPLGFLIMIVSLTTYANIMEMVNGIIPYRYLAITMQVALPLIILIAVEIKLYIGKHKESKQKAG